MQRILNALAITVAVMTACAAVAQSPELHNPNITVRYEEPRYLKIYQQLKARKVLERLDQLLSPLKLDHPLTLSIDEGARGAGRAPIRITTRTSMSCTSATAGSRFWRKKCRCGTMTNRKSSACGRRA